MDFVELALIQTEDEEGKSHVVLYAGDKAVIGIAEVSFGSDDGGTYLNIQARRFRLGQAPESEESSDDDEEEPAS